MSSRRYPVLLTIWLVVIMHQYCFSTWAGVELIRSRFQVTNHRINNVRLLRSNVGLFGGGQYTLQMYDAFTGMGLEIGSEFPANGHIQHLNYVGLAVGATVQGDTLVSTGWGRANMEFYSDIQPFGNLERRSNLYSDSVEASNSVSQEDIIAVYTDTIISPNQRDHLSGRLHIPLKIEVTNRSYAWSFGYAEDFVIFDMSIRNLGTETLSETFVGLEVSSSVRQVGNEAPSWDDFCGFVRYAPSNAGCVWIDTLNMAWQADADGDPVNGRYQESFDPYRSAPHVSALRFLNTPLLSSGTEPRISFNWLVQIENSLWDWGPIRRENVRNFRTGSVGYPAGDLHMYHILSGAEIDYDMPYTASIAPLDRNWLYPPQEIARDIVDGAYVPVYFLSTGPFNIPPGGVLNLAYAYVCGENLHRDPLNIRNLPNNPDAYMANLDFSDLIKNARNAAWIYDNPGVDTDSNGYAGEFDICIADSVFRDGIWQPTVAETTWVKGDGVPDWRAAGPPPAPEFWVTPVENGIRVRFNGYRSETEKDIFSRMVDFEGYRIYLGRDVRWDNMALVASYDRENYDRWEWRATSDTGGVWVVGSIPISLDSLRCLYGRQPEPCHDSTFDPLSTAAHRPFHPQGDRDSLLYFVQHDYNASEFGVTTDITKIYPDEPDPSLWPPDEIPAEAYTDDGYLKYYEYESTIENLLSTVPYWVNVTAFDYGSAVVHLDALETSRTLGAKEVYPLSYSSSPTATGDLKVYVYPNPYRIDGGYRDSGYEGRMREDRADNRVREVHFANLPPKCKISIFSLDGDLIRSIDHDIPESDPNHTHDSWDLITRNTQEPVSGLYYWVVEASDGRTQIGKLVLIM